MKRLYALILALAMALSLAACGSSDSGETEQTDDGAAAETTDDGAAAEVEELTINLYNPVAGEVTDTSYTIFADKVSELSGGKITCNITPAGTLGAEREPPSCC